MNEPKTVLLATGDRDLSGAVKRSLTESGYKTDIAYDGVQAVNLFGQTRYDLLIISDSLTRIRTEDVICAFRKETPAPIVIISSKEYGFYKAEGIPHENVGVVCLPFTEKFLFDAINNGFKAT